MEFRSCLRSMLGGTPFHASFQLFTLPREAVFWLLQLLQICVDIEQFSTFLTQMFTRNVPV